MSAWIISHDHADYVVTALKRHGGTIDANRAQDLGREMMRECERSVAYRYPGDARDELPGTVGQRWDNYTFREWEGNIDPATTAVAVASYQYQTCEHPDHAEAETWKLLAAFRDYLESITTEAERERVGTAGWDIYREAFALEAAS